MRPLLTPAEMAAADERTIGAGTSAEELMERAGRAVARAALQLVGGRYGKTAVVFSGPGNNGGDGFVAARRLALDGLHVRCFVVGDLEAVSGAAASKLEQMLRAGVRADDLGGSLSETDVIVDALFGTGFRGRAEGEAAKAIEAMNASSAPVVSVDIPSGVQGATGAVTGPAVRADVTVAFAAEKVGTACAPGAGYAGRVLVTDIGIEIPVVDLHVTEIPDVAAALPARYPDAHKGNTGAVTIVAGSAAMTGAALLVARGADRAGAGYVRMDTVAEVKAAVAARLPEVISRVVASGGYDAGSWDDVAEDAAKAGVLAIGPGMGRDEGVGALVLRALRESDVPLVLDADGLAVLGSETGALARPETVITPHPGEMAGLLDVTAADVQTDRLGAARRAADAFGCVVLLKGFRTVVAAPSGTAVVNPAGGPELATAGTGDVLTGVIAALLAAGTPAFEAAWAAAFVHGTAGGLAARRRGPAGVVAWDVAEHLPRAVRHIRSAAA